MIRLLLVLLLGTQLCHSQEPQLSPNAPSDKPVNADSVGRAKLQATIQPYIEFGRKTYPDAKARYLQGLPLGEIFFIVTVLHDKQGRVEQVFVRVSKIDHETIVGTIANDIDIVQDYHEGQQVSVPESEILDWLISKPDGTEEGNVVGKFLDTYKPN